MEKCVLKVVGQEAKESWGMGPFCGVLEAFNEGGIHTMCLLWK